MPDNNEYVPRIEFTSRYREVDQQVRSLSRDLTDLKVQVAAHERYWKMIEAHIAKEESWEKRMRDIQMGQVKMQEQMRILGVVLLVAIPIIQKVIEMIPRFK